MIKVSGMQEGLVLGLQGDHLKVSVRVTEWVRLSVCVSFTGRTNTRGTGCWELFVVDCES